MQTKQNRKKLEKKGCQLQQYNVNSDISCGSSIGISMIKCSITCQQNFHSIALTLQVIWLYYRSVEFVVSCYVTFCDFSFVMIAFTVATDAAAGSVAVVIVFNQTDFFVYFFFFCQISSTLEKCYNQLVIRIFLQ